MGNKAVYELTVVANQQLTSSMRRIMFAGEDLRQFPPQSKGGYIKLLFRDNHQPVRSLQEFEIHADQLLRRTYTVRDVDTDNATLTLDVVVHDHAQGHAVASSWAQAAVAGDRISIAGPGPAKLADPLSDWFLFVGDMTALLAISCNLELLPATATGYAVIEVNDEADIQPLKVPQAIELIWVSKKSPSTGNSELLAAIEALPWLAGAPYVWSACEFSLMRQLRSYFKKVRAVPKQQLYISSYWKMGRSEDQHKVDKRRDARREQISGFFAGYR